MHKLLKRGQPEADDHTHHHIPWVAILIAAVVVVVVVLHLTGVIGPGSH